MDKIDANGTYGALGMYTSLIYNINVATSITSQGRALVSSMTLFFEMFLADNVKFGSLDQVLEFINNVVKEKKNRKFNDFKILKNPNIPVQDVFAKIILDCGYRWIPNEEEMDIIWRVLNNLGTEDLRRVYYKNNLYEFMENSIALDHIIDGLKKTKCPMYNTEKVPVWMQDDVNLVSDLLYEYVYYRYMFIDRIDRCDNMCKAVTMVSDTDSTIISLDAWYRYILSKINENDLFRIANFCTDPITIISKNEYDEWEAAWQESIEFEPKQLDYNFQTDEIVELEHMSHPDIMTPNDNIRYTIINILGFILDRIVNDYMEKFCENNNSLTPDRKCRIIAKNEFLMRRVLMTQVKKNYASIMELQEGNIVPYDKQLDIKGIEILHKSSTPLSTRKALQKILAEDILRTPVIDQLKFMKDIMIFEKQIVKSLKDGSKEFFKPVTVKAMSSYSDPMKIQGVKASIAWNYIKPEGYLALNLDERNPVNIVKVIIDKSTANNIKDKYPEVYDNIMRALESPEFAKDKEISAVALPFEEATPDWLFEFINFTEIISNNLSGFPYESIGIMRMKKDNINCTNIVKL